MEHRQLPDGWDKDLPSFPADAKGLATRDSSGKVENAIAKNVPWLMGGSADLAPSTKTLLTFEAATGFQAGKLFGPEFALRHPRARHVRDHQRHEPDQSAPVRRDVFRVHRLHARRHAAERDHGNSGHLRSDARFARRRRRRAHASADRASGDGARHARPDHVAPGGRQ